MLAFTEVSSNCNEAQLMVLLQCNEAYAHNLDLQTNLLCLIEMIAEEIGAKSGSIPCFHNCRGIEKSYR
jgi:hypothetical protein